MDESLEARLAAVERTLTDGDHDTDALADAAEVAERIETVESDLADLTDRVAELEAASQALRGYVGNVRAVNEEVQQRADLALSKAETAAEAASGTPPGRATPPDAAGGPDRDPNPSSDPDLETVRGTAPSRAEGSDLADLATDRSDDRAGTTLLDRVRALL